MQKSVKCWTFWPISWDLVHIFQTRFFHWNRGFKPVDLSTMNPINWTKFFLLTYKGSFRILTHKSTQLKFWKFYFFQLILVLYTLYQNNPHQHISKFHFSILQLALCILRKLSSMTLRQRYLSKTELEKKYDFDSLRKFMNSLCGNCLLTSLFWVDSRSPRSINTIQRKITINQRDQSSLKGSPSTKYFLERKLNQIDKQSNLCPFKPKSSNFLTNFLKFW